MKAFIVLALLLLSISSFTKAADSDVTFESDYVTQLDDSNYDDFISNNKNVFVKIYAPWCGHCQKLWPEYVELAEDLKVKYKDLKFAKLQGDDESTNQTITKLKVKHFPTLYLYVNGKKIKYHGKPNRKEIEMFINKQFKEPTYFLNNLKQAKDFMNKNQEEIVMLLFTKDDRSQSEFKEYNKFAQFTESAMVAVTFSQEVKDFYKVTTDNTIILIKNFDEPIITYDGPIKKDSLVKFLNKNKVPYYMNHKNKRIDGVYQNKKTILWLVLNKDDAHSKQLQDGVEQMLPKLKEQGVINNVVWMNADKKAANFLSEIGLQVKGTQYPKIVLTYMVNNDFKKYICATSGNDLTLSVITNYIADYNAKKLQPFYKSQPIPTEQKGAVTQLVGLNYKEVSTNENQDVLIMYYAPWCGHCQALKPIYENLAISLAKNDKIVIAKLDATKNDVDFAIDGFPTLKFYVSGRKERPVECNARTYNQFIKFLQKNTAFPWVEPEPIEEPKKKKAEKQQGEKKSDL